MQRSSIEVRTLKILCGSKKNPIVDELIAMGLEGKEVFHIKLSHMAIITSPPWWVLGTQGSWQLGREAQKVRVDKILSSTIAPNVCSDGKRYHRAYTNNRGGERLRFYKEAYCTVFSGTWFHAAPAHVVQYVDMSAISPCKSFNNKSCN